MKKLFLFFIFSGSLDLFSQDTLAPKPIDTAWWVKNPPFSGCLRLRVNTSEVTPDTLHAILVVYRDRGPAILHAKLGYVVRKWREEEVYLDDKKRVVKSPLEVFSYKLKK